MRSKCLRRGCEKEFWDPEERCDYHPGPPVFHEGQKGWQCCKPRVLTFEEFLAIPPCTFGKHSSVQDSGHEAQKAKLTGPSQLSDPTGKSKSPSEHPKPVAPAVKTTTFPKESAPLANADSDSGSDDASVSIVPGLVCRRRGCGAKSDESTSSPRNDEECIYHPGKPVFHEGSKGWSCCKKKVLDFDQFLDIVGCKTKTRHLYIGENANRVKDQQLSEIRSDFYQTKTSVIASLFLKNIKKDKSQVLFLSSDLLEVDLHTEDNKVYAAKLPLFGHIDESKSTFNITKAKLEFSLVKRDEKSWPTLRSDEERPGGIIQLGRTQTGA